MMEETASGTTGHAKRIDNNKKEIDKCRPLTTEEVRQLDANLCQKVKRKMGHNPSCCPIRFRAQETC